MKIAFYLNIVSPHQIPLAREVARLVGDENFRYFYAEDFHAERKAIGWDSGEIPAWCVAGDERSPELLEADLVYTGIRCVDLMEKRAALGKRTVYYSERWFKPRLGLLRLLSPSYRRMARKIADLVSCGCVEYYSCGIHAARDMARLCGLMHGDWRCLFRAPRLEFENKPGGRLFLTQRHRGSKAQRLNARGYCLDKMRMWGYFVEEGRGKREEGRGEREEGILKVLWVGRLLNLKRVDTIVRAVGEHANLKRVDTSLPNITLDIYGIGPEESRLKKLAAKYGDCIKFHPPVPIAEVRKLMREHDVYVLSSNAFEGWGAVVSEALEEGMLTLGTYEAGSSATMLPESHLFRAGDWRALAVLLRKAAGGDLEPTGIGDWTAEKAAKYMMLN